MKLESSCDLVEAIWDGIATENSPYQWAATVFGATVLLTFVVSTLTKNYSQVDKLWSIMPVAYAWMPVCDSRTLVMACLVSVWGIRLTYNFHRRGGYQWPPWQGDEDYRWSVIQRGGFLSILKNPRVWTIFNLGFISFYQNVILLWITAPSFVAYTVATTPACRQVYRDSLELGMGDIFTSIVFLAFVVIEAVADRQQYTFQTEKYRRKKHDEILTGEYADGFKQSGLFAVVRKPNYAAEQAIWMSFFIFSFLLVSWNWSVLGIIQLVLLFQTSGWFTEKISKLKYEKYKDYMRQVPLYIPNPFYACQCEMRKKMNTLSFP
jgi:steroid 5-alpha reductase family enzyme